MTTEQELNCIWRQLTDVYQQVQRCNNRAEGQRLTALAEMLRTEYRHLTSTYR